MVPIFTTNLGKLYCTDCADVLCNIPSDSIDLIITDPPYVGLQNVDWDKRDVFTEEIVLHLYRILKNTGSFYLWCGVGKKCNSCIRWYNLCSKHFQFRDWITWKKQRGIGMMKGWLYTREEILWFTKTDNYVWNKEHQYSKEEYEVEWQNRLGKKYKRLTNVWTDIKEVSLSGRVGVKGQFKKINHPTAKPVELMERLILVHTKPQDVVLDCFAGSGPVLVAAEKLNRKWIGIEINEQYCEIIKNRLQGAQKQLCL